MAEAMEAAERHAVPSFTDLRLLAATSPVVHACIELVTAQVRATDWEIAPRRGWSPEWLRDGEALRQPCEQASRFFGGIPGYPLGAWLGFVVRDVLTIGCAGVSLHPSPLPSLCLTDPAMLAPGTIAGRPCTFEFDREVSRQALLAGLTADATGSRPQSVRFLFASDLLYAAYDPDPETGLGRPPLERAWRTGGDGSLDLAATEARVPQEFGIRLGDLGMKDDGADVAPLAPVILEWLRGCVLHPVLRGTLGFPDLEWRWLVPDA